LTLATSAGSDPRVSPDIFISQSTETPWEWAKARRQWFKTPAKDLLGGAFLALPGLAVRFSAGNPNWVRATVEAVGTALIGAVILPQLETLYWRIRRRGILLDERERKLAEREAAPLSPPPAAPPHAAPATAVDQPRAEVTLECDATGWARLRVTNTGAGADFSATIQLYGFTAGAVEGRQIYARWELGDGAQRRLAAGETRTLRLASITQIAAGVRAWTVHRADGEDIKGVELAEFMEVQLVANPDLVEPCQLQILLNADGGSRMARGGVDQPLFHTVPPRVAHMRRLLVEAANHIRAIPYGLGKAKAAIYMSVMVKFHNAEFVEQAFGKTEAEAYSARFTDNLHPTQWQETSAGLLLDLAQRATEANILPSFELPITWNEFYERHPDWEWPEYDD
jgi:hypothetical protein